MQLPLETKTVSAMAAFDSNCSHPVVRSPVLDQSKYTIVCQSHQCQKCPTVLSSSSFVELTKNLPNVSVSSPKMEQNMKLQQINRAYRNVPHKQTNLDLVNRSNGFSEQKSEICSRFLRLKSNKIRELYCSHLKGLTRHLKEDEEGSHKNNRLVASNKYLRHGLLKLREASSLLFSLREKLGVYRFSPVCFARILELFSSYLILVFEMADTESDSLAVVAGQKRGNPDNGGPASKRANVTDLEGQSLRVRVFHILFSVQVKILIPAGAVGALIGKGGESMRNLKNDSGCRVQMSKNQELFQSRFLESNV